MGRSSISTKYATRTGRGDFIPEYNLEDGLDKLSQLINIALSRHNGVVLVKVAGGSASGKTSAVADKIKNTFGELAIIISMDDYYFGSKYLKQEAKKGNIINWDQPEALNIELLGEHLNLLRKGESINKPIYGFNIDPMSKFETVKPHKIIILEGLFALNDKLIDDKDIKAFVDVSVHGRVLRRILRDVNRTGQGPHEILKYFSDVVEPMHQKYVQSTRKNADIIIKNEYDPNIEFVEVGANDVQLKFKLKSNSNVLGGLDVKSLGSVIQQDYYCKPKDDKLARVDEVVRVREENGHVWMTYKGPIIKSKYQKRLKLEFEIDRETADSFLAIYDNQKGKLIKKTRLFYNLDGVPFVIDSVIKVENGIESNLGFFVEIKLNNNYSKQKVGALLNKLGLKDISPIKQSYSEM